uniref:Uncharacterized protein n=1 Tax=Panagrolaimus superbus TaxID=310955 RepID=A0A914YNC5_9BILA
MENELREANNCVVKYENENFELNEKNVQLETKCNEANECKQKFEDAFQKLDAEKTDKVCLYHHLIFLNRFLD